MNRKHFNIYRNNSNFNDSDNNANNNILKLKEKNAKKNGR